MGPVQPCGCGWPFSSGGVGAADELVCAGWAEALWKKQSAAKHKIVVGNFTSDPPVRVLNRATLPSVPERALQ